MDAMLSDFSGVDTTAFTPDDGDPSNAQHAGATGLAWHRRIPSKIWLWLIVVGAIAGLWAIAGSFRKVLS